MRSVGRERRRGEGELFRKSSEDWR